MENIVKKEKIKLCNLQSIIHFIYKAVNDGSDNFIQNAINPLTVNSKVAININGVAT